MDLLVERTDKLNQSAFRFERKSKHLKQTMWWQKVKFRVFLAVVLLVRICPSQLANFVPGTEVLYAAPDSYSSTWDWRMHAA